MHFVYVNALEVHTLYPKMRKWITHVAQCYASAYRVSYRVHERVVMSTPRPSTHTPTRRLFITQIERERSPTNPMAPATRAQKRNSSTAFVLPVVQSVSPLDTTKS
jgi:hypothetical protein